MHITDLEHIPASEPQPCHIPRPEELHGSRLLRDAVVAESARTEGGESDTASQGTARGGASWGMGMGWDFLQAGELIRDGSECPLCLGEYRAGLGCLLSRG